MSACCRPADDSDLFLKTFFGADPLPPVNSTKDPTTEPIPPVNGLSDTSVEGASSSSEAPSLVTALLSVPVDCDTSLWSAFVQSSLWEWRTDDKDDQPLLEHFNTFASQTLVVRDGPSEFGKESADADSAGHFYRHLASRATQKNQRALMHAVLCVSAQHLANWARKVNDVAKAVRCKDQSGHHKHQALHLVRIATASESEEDKEIFAAIMVLLILAAVRSHP